MKPFLLSYTTQFDLYKCYYHLVYAENIDQAIELLENELTITVVDVVNCTIMPSSLKHPIN